MLELYLKENDSNVLRFPVTPSEVICETSASINTESVNDLGEVSLFSGVGLKSIPIDSFFPNKDYSFCTYSNIEFRLQFFINDPSIRKFYDYIYYWLFFDSNYLHFLKIRFYFFDSFCNTHKSNLILLNIGNINVKSNKKTTVLVALYKIIMCKIFYFLLNKLLLLYCSAVLASTSK